MTTHDTPTALAAYRTRHRIDPKRCLNGRMICAVDYIRINRRQGGWIHDSDEVHDLFNEVAAQLSPGDYEIPDITARKNGRPKIGERCPWCGMVIEGPDHGRSHD